MVYPIFKRGHRLIYFCLSGEGARGAYQAYEIRKLEKDGIIPNALYGTSSGALNSFVYSLTTAQYLQDMWGEINNFWDVFGINFFQGSGFFNYSPIKKKLSKLIGRMFKVNINIYYSNALNGRPYSYHIVAGKICDEIDIQTVIAAISIPGIVELSNTQFCDAMVSCLLPLPNPQNIERGDKVYLIVGRDFGSSKEVRKPWRYFSQIWHLNNMLDQMMANQIREKIILANEICEKKGAELIVKQPKILYRDSLDFTQCKYLANGLSCVSKKEFVSRIK